MSLEQIEQMVRAANPVPDVAILGGSRSPRGQLIEQEAATTETDAMLLLDRSPDGPTPDQRGRRRPILPSLNGERVVDVDVRDTHVTSADDLAGERHPGRRWMLVAAATIAVLGLGLLVVTAVRDPDSVRTDTVSPTPAPSTNPATTSPLPGGRVPQSGPFVGVWLSTDTDGSSQIMEIVRSGIDDYAVVVHDDAATVACSGAAATVTGTGRLPTAETLIVARPVLTCDDGTTPSIGSPPQEEIVNLAFDREAATDELVDSFGVLWRREGSGGGGETASPLTTVPGPAVNLAAHEAVMGRLIEALNTAAADDAVDDTSLRAVFTEDATISPFEGWDQSPVTAPGLLERWILHLRAWGFDGALGECWTDVGNLFCSVHARWPTLLAEADEAWLVDVVGGRIQTLTVTGNGQRFEDPTLPLSVAELDGWEQWLHETDPQTAATLIPAAESADPAVSRYEPALAAEINASIRQYVEQRPPGEEISVTADLVDFGDRLVGLVSNMARADGHTYVIAGRYQTEGDLLTAPEQAVLAAFDDVGTELWRIDLDETPRQVVAVAGDVWVLHGTGTLSRIDASDGRMIDQVTVGNGSSTISSAFAAFGSVWVHAFDLEGRPGQLIRVDPDMETTSIELPASVVNPDDIPQAPAAGTGGIWVPLGGAGVAVVDVETDQVTVIPVDDIGHEVLSVAVEGDVAYVASRNRVTSIVDREVLATVSPGEIWYLGYLDGAFGILQPGKRFSVLKSTDPMVVDVRQVTEAGSPSEIDGEAWVETGRNYNLRRVEFLPDPEADGG